MLFENQRWVQVLNAESLVGDQKIWMLGNRSSERRVADGPPFVITVQPRFGVPSPRRSSLL